MFWFDAWTFLSCVSVCCLRRFVNHHGKSIQQTVKQLVSGDDKQVCLRYDILCLFCSSTTVLRAPFCCRRLSVRRLRFLAAVLQFGILSRMNFCTMFWCYSSVFCFAWTMVTPLFCSTMFYSMIDDTTEWTINREMGVCARSVRVRGACPMLMLGITCCRYRHNELCLAAAVSTSYGDVPRYTGTLCFGRGTVLLSEGGVWGSYPKKRRNCK